MEGVLQYPVLVWNLNYVSGEVAGKLVQQTTTAMPGLWVIHHNYFVGWLVATIALSAFRAQRSDREQPPCSRCYYDKASPDKTFRLM